MGELQLRQARLAGQWRHIGLVYNLDDNLRCLYVDAIPVAVDTDGVAGVSSDGTILIGTGRDLEPGSFGSGLINDVQVYDEAMTLEEIAEMILWLESQAKRSE